MHLKNLVIYNSMTTQIERQLIDSIIELRPQLKKFALSLTKEEADDLVQDTLLKAISHVGNYFDHGTNLKAWVFTIMKNTFINNYKRKVKMPQVSSEYDEIVLMQSREITADSIIHTEYLMALIDDLPEKERTSFKLFIMGYRYNEICDIVQKPLGTVKSRIWFARKSLMNKLKHE